MSEMQRLNECAALMRESRYAEAAERAEAALAGFPRGWGLWHLLGAARLALGNAEGARAALEEAVRGVPNNALALELLAIALQRLQRRDEAAAAFARSLALRPGAAAVWSNAAANAYERERFDEALELAERALALDSSLGAAHLVRGNALHAMARWEDATRALQQAADLLPDRPEVLATLGLALGWTSERARARALLAQVVAEHPDLVLARTNYATVLFREGQVKSALEQYRVALDLDPLNFRIWNGYLFAMTHQEDIAPEATFAEHVRFGQRMESVVEASTVWANSRDPERRLRVGFVSGDLREHAVAYFMEPIWSAIDRSAIELHAYHNYPVEDAVSHRLQACVDVWTNVHGMSDAALDARIRADGIDILFDMSGHTDYNRLALFARKPAPVQITWIGYPCTTGLKAMDYRFVNGATSPPGLADHVFVEKLVYLSVGSRFRSPEGAPDVAPPPMLKNGHVTFGSFNRTSKLSAQSIALWSAALARQPDARMLLGGTSDEETQRRIIEQFERNGIARSRISFRPRVPLNEYLALHREVDFLLDTVPYSGGTTTSHGLWMGVPTLTLIGTHYQQRQSAWRLIALGMRDWIVEDEASFVERACAHASDPDALARLRAGLRDRLRAAAESAERGDDLTIALRTVWRHWCAGLEPVAFDLRKMEHRG